MADKDKPGEDVNLEMPSLGLGGRRRRRKKDAEHPAPIDQATGTETGPETSTEPVQPLAPELSAGEARPAAEPDPTPVEPVEARSIEPADDALTILDEPEDAPTIADAVGSEDTRVLPDEDTRPLFADETPDDTAVHDSTEEPAGHHQAAEEADNGGGFALPAIAPMTAAMISGVVVGLLAVGATYLGLRGCEAIQGTSSCGGPGLFLLIAIMVGLILVGGFMLRAWGVSDPMSTSFLAVGLLAVVALLFLVDVIFSQWMLLVIPLIALGTFTLSHWVTVSFIEPAENDKELHDVE